MTARPALAVMMLSDSFASVWADGAQELDAELRLVFISGRVSELFGQEPQAMLGHHPWEVPWAESRGEDWDAFPVALQAREPLKDIVFRSRNAQGDLRVTRITGIPLVGGDGRHQLLGNLGVQLGFPLAGLAHRLQQVIGSNIFEQVALGTGAYAG